MLRGLFTAASGMNAQQLVVDNIANNLANVNTAGFKKRRVNFQDLLYQTIQQPGTLSTAESEVPTGLQIGHGTRPVSIQPIFTSGPLVETDNAFDVAIEGPGFFQIRQPDNTVAYTRDGSFQIGSNGEIMNSDGFLLEPLIQIDPDSKSRVTIGIDGTVSVIRDGESGSTNLGQIELVTFANAAGLEQKGGNMLLETDASGPPIIGTPGEEGIGIIRQNFLELSNVQVVEEMVNLIMAQRAYEVNSKTIQTTDEMLQQANNLRR